MAISKRLINKILNVNTSYIIASDKKTVTSFIQCIVREDINFFFFGYFSKFSSKFLNRVLLEGITRLLKKKKSCNLCM